MYLDFRTHIKAPTRRPKERPTHLPIRADPDDPASRKLIPVEDHPRILYMPHFNGEPEMFSGRAKEVYRTFDCSWNGYGVPEDLDRITQYNPGLVYDVSLAPEPFILLLGKIAHGMAWGMVGEENFLPYLSGLVRRTEKDMLFYVGEDTLSKFDIQIKSPDHFVLATLLEWGGKWLVVIRMHLWCKYQPHVYVAVAGELTPVGQSLIQLALAREGPMIVRDPEQQSDTPPGPNR
jgi:hypothetical protein